MRSKFSGMMLFGLALLMTACKDEYTAGSEQPLLAARLTAISSSMTRPTMWLTDSTLFVGDTTTVGIRITDRFGRVIRNNRAVEFTSRDEKVATVRRSSGLMAVVGYGSTYIVTRAFNGARDSLLVTIEPVNAPSAQPAPDLNLGSIVAPALPRATVPTGVPAVTGRRWNIPAGDMAALQNAVDKAVGGDEIVLPNNSEFIGSLTLSKHAGSGAVTLRSATVPAAGVRVSPATSASFARIVTTDSRPAIGTAPGASGWRIIGVQALQRNDEVMNYGIVRLGSGSETVMSDFPSDIVLDRIFVSAGTMGNTRRCVGLNGSSLAVIHSWLVECHSKGFDSQAVAGWTGTGPFLVENNHLEGSSETISWGGSDPKIRGVTPSDITIRGNHLYRPMRWVGSPWLVKNLFELKHARRLLFEGNVMENNWADGQSGYAILFQSTVQDGIASWTTIEDITVRNNILRNSTSGIHLLSRFTSTSIIPEGPSKRILFQNNLFIDVGRDPANGRSGRVMQLLTDLEDVSIVSNTFVGGTPNDAIVFEGLPQKRLRIERNVFQSSQYGMFGAGTGEGTASLERFAPGYTVSGNVFPGRLERMYPTGNSFPAAVALDAFTNPGGGDYTLRSTLPFAFSGGKPVGVNGSALLTATRGAVTR